ncbi:SusD/RagB family nutrient-binding outer membrane lipoprotein [Allomuricauda sp. SCSIO 64092]|uniref:SusD/RagB family nutrient-binding outer membrane lipoprotein n=1 Tax=Allomuricauda sp. SCSIO 64092 TaxID=2908842 RepID=UPI0028BE462B|nr:SusD/RagB family nutrient-binding outer membrane lipoprotein [Muricauda sp. SCSIO 64092]
MMKKERIVKKIGAIVGALLFTLSCTDNFDELNTSPFDASEDQVLLEYFINASIGGAQQDPHIGERIFYWYWKDASRMDRLGSLSVGINVDGWTSDYFDRYVSTWLRDINSGINVVDEQIAEGNINVYTDNLKQVARIWRAYLMSEMSDNFGPIPVDGFKGENPTYSSVEEVYTFILSELKEATEALDLSIINPDDLTKFDPAYGYDYEKWRKYGNSLRMRLAMRLSEVAPSRAQEEFEDAVSGGYIATLDENFKVQELDGWNNFTGVMTRPWNNQFISAALNNIMIGLGGVPSEDQLPAELHSYIKPANYLGVRYEDHFTLMTNDPSAGFWFDGLHNTIDPRAYEAFKIPGNVDDPDFNVFPPWNSAATTTEGRLVIGESDNDQNGETDDIELDAAFTWNAPVHGSWGPKGQLNQIINTGTLPRLGNQYRNSEAERIFFASWESHFLIAEAALRGWNVPMGAKAAYEQGITDNFMHTNTSQHLSTYLTSQDYNRVGTSVNWDHTDEPPSTVSMDYVNGYTDAPGTYSFSYPQNTIYNGGTVKNDHLTKIITQKFIAQTPWLPLEAWNDHRRLGLPFFENPAIEIPLVELPQLTPANFMTNQVNFFPQRLRYPSNFTINLPGSHQQALGELGGEDTVHTPLWWAKQE